MAGNFRVYRLRKIQITGACAFFSLDSLSQIDIVSRAYASRRGLPTVPPCGKLQGFATLTVNPVFKLFLILGKSERRGCGPESVARRDRESLRHEAFKRTQTTRETRIPCAAYSSRRSGFY